MFPPGKKLSDLERVTSLKVYNWFANRRKEIKRRANIGNVALFKLQTANEMCVTVSLPAHQVPAMTSAGGWQWGGRSNCSSQTQAL